MDRALEDIGLPICLPTVAAPVLAITGEHMVPTNA